MGIFSGYHCLLVWGKNNEQLAMSTHTVSAWHPGISSCAKLWQPDVIFAQVGVTSVILDCNQNDSTISGLYIIMSIVKTTFLERQQSFLTFWEFFETT